MVEVDILEKFYQATKAALVEAKNEVCNKIEKNRQRLTVLIASFSQDQLETCKVVARQEGVCTSVQSTWFYVTSML